MEQALREHEERVRAAAAEERRHVARELHDVLAHAVSVMVVQAGAARQVLRTSPDQAEEAMLAVEATGREAMTELRQFLGALSDDEAAGVAPQPGIRELDSLVERVREAGLPASLEVDGEPRSVSPSLDVAVFRIVQEALTNALKYAGLATTLVRLSWEPDRLQVEILDDGPAGGRSAGDRARPCRDARTRVAGRRDARSRAAGRWRVCRPGVAAAGSDGRLGAFALMTDRPLRVLIADDQALVRAGFRMILEAQPDIQVVAEAADGDAALRLARRHRPDIVLMDVRMPGLDGLEATRRLLAGDDPSGSAPPRVVILTTFDLDEYVYAALQSGASGFLLKDVSPEHLVGAVRTVAIGDALLAPSITRRLVERYARPAATLPADSEALGRLTARETEVFGLVARGMSNAEIAAALVVTEATVKTHVAGILAKLGLRNRAQIVVLAYESGFIRAGSGASSGE